MLVGALRPRPGKPAAPCPEEIVTALFQGLLEREPDPGGLAAHVEHLNSGRALADVIRGYLASAEFRARMMAALVPRAELPDLTQSMPDRYERQTADGSPITLYRAAGADEIALMQSLIERHRYYDRFDVWSPVIDLDKRVTARIVLGLQARSCFELGCFTGPVLSLLAEAGIAVAGSEVSHHAFAFAYPNVRDHILFGDLLDLPIGRRFDVVLCMDVLEHLSPLRLDNYIAKLRSLIEDDGHIYVNSPMWGHDPVFGTIAEQYLESWRRIGDASYWPDWPCDEKGWPQHGHLIWASPNWWSGKFAAHGLVRDVAVEAVIHHRLAPFFGRAPARRSLFVLRRADRQDAAAASAAALDAALAQLPQSDEAEAPPQS